MTPPPAIAPTHSTAAASADSDLSIMPTPSPSPPPSHSATHRPAATTHSLLHYLRPSTPTPRFALILVNRPLTHLPTSLLVDLWLNAEWRLCADGGANQLFDRLAHDPALQRRLIPHIIAGDLDSVRPDVVEFYRQLGTKVHKSTCQNSTDLGKCMLHLESIERHLKIPVTLDLVILGGTDGRFDQTLGVVHTMHAIAATGRKVSLLDGHNYMTVLTPNSAHRLDLVHPLQGPHCGLLPVGGPAIVSTRGLVWDMDLFLLSFATVISACNQVDRAYAGDEVPAEWVARGAVGKVRPDQISVTFDELERAMARTKLACSANANGDNKMDEDERVDLTCATTRSAAHAAKAYALTPYTPSSPLASSFATHSAPGTSPPVSPTLLRKSPPTLTKSARSPSVSSLEPVPPALHEGESVSHVFVETTQPVVWTVEVDFGGYRSAV